MASFFFTSAEWRRALWVSLIFTFCAFFARFFGYYPRCSNDELNWIGIVNNIDAGYEWPVSGPGFVFILRILKKFSDLHYIQLISGLGVIGVFLGVILINFGYCKLRVVRPSTAILVLALSSYFWVPLLEVRPQQWGQILVFIGVIFVWQWLNYQGGWLFFPVLALISVLHILSHAVFIFLCSILIFADFFENRPINRRHLIASTCIFLSLMVYILPNGPYKSMLYDIKVNHLEQLLWATPYVGGLVLFALLIFIYFRPRLHWRAHWSMHTLEFAFAHKYYVYAVILFTAAAVMAVQAAILPDASWLPYRGSFWIFLIFQSGNLIFAYLFSLGLFAVAREIITGNIDFSKYRMIIWTLVAFSMLGFLTLIASFWMLDTNWILRLINYAILFSAPIVVKGLGSIEILKKKPLIYLIFMPLFIVSFCQAIRPSGYLDC